MEPARVKIPVFLLLLAAGIQAFASEAAGVLNGAPGAVRTRADRIISSMNEEELLGQVFMLGWIGTEPSPDIKKWIGERRIGGVKVFTRNVEDLAVLARGIAEMQKLSKAAGTGVPLFIATDQEGGWVRQVKLQTSVSPGNLALGASRLPRDAFLTGYYLGKELAVLGINMNFAPTVDVYANPEASVIGPRSFGSDPRETGLLSAAWLAGMRKAGIICVAKHFPGHGSADKDSHGHLPVIDATLDTLRSRDLVPYRILAKEEAPAVMSAHLAFPSILGSLTPSSLSSFFIRDILRGELGFKGIVITDDMEMEGVLNGTYDTPTACRLALEAGNDMVLISHSPLTQEKTWRALLKAMRESPSFASIVKESARRIVETKLKCFRETGSADPDDPSVALLGDPSVDPSIEPWRTTLLDPPKPSAIQASIPASGAPNFFFQSSCRGVNVVSRKRLPFLPDAARKILLCGQFSEFLDEGKLRYPQADTLLFPFIPFYRSRAEDRSRVTALAARYDAVIFCLANFNSLEVLKELDSSAKKLVVVSALSPVYLAEVPWVETAVAVFGSGRDSFRAGFAALKGDYKPSATMPLHFESPGDK